MANEWRGGNGEGEWRMGNGEWGMTNEWRKSFGLALPMRSVSVGNMGNGEWGMTLLIKPF